MTCLRFILSVVNKRTSKGNTIASSLARGGKTDREQVDIFSLLGKRGLRMPAAAPPLKLAHTIDRTHTSCVVVAT